MTTIDTKKVTDRRNLSFKRMDDILADVEALDGGKLRATGNWTPAQNVGHVSMLIAGSLDGFGDLEAPFALRMMIRLMRNRLLREPFRAGIKPSPQFSRFVPAEDVTWEDAVADLRRQVGRVTGGEKMTAVSPVFGKLSHEQWVQMHCRHAELHFSFIGC